MQTAVSIIALVLSVVSLTWQAATFVLSGGRARVELLAGAMNARGDHVTAELREWTQEWVDRMAERGFVHPVFAVRVYNTGRMSLTVEAWGFNVLDVPRRTDQVGMTSLSGAIAATRKRPVAGLTPARVVLSGPDFPHRVEAGGKRATWTIDASEVLTWVESVREDLKMPAAVPIAAVVELGNGRIYRSGPEWIRP